MKRLNVDLKHLFGILAVIAFLGGCSTTAVKVDPAKEKAQFYRIKENPNLVEAQKDINERQELAQTEKVFSKQLASSQLSWGSLFDTKTWWYWGSGYVTMGNINKLKEMKGTEVTAGWIGFLPGVNVPLGIEANFAYLGTTYTSVWSGPLKGGVALPHNSRYDYAEPKNPSRNGGFTPATIRNAKLLLTYRQSIYKTELFLLRDRL